MKKKEYLQPQAKVLIIDGDALMNGEWWSVQVNPEEEIEDDDIGAKQTFWGYDDSWGNKANLWEE